MGITWDTSVMLTGSLQGGSAPEDEDRGRTSCDFLGLAVFFLVASNPVSRHCARRLVGRCCKLCPGTERMGSYGSGGVRSHLWGQNVAVGKGGSKESQAPADSSSRVIRMQSDASAAPCPAQDAQPGIKSSCYRLLASNRAIKHKKRERCPGWDVMRQLIHRTP